MQIRIGNQSAIVQLGNNCTEPCIRRICNCTSHGRVQFIIVTHGECQIFHENSCDHHLITQYSQCRLLDKAEPVTKVSVMTSEVHS